MRRFLVPLTLILASTMVSAQDIGAFGNWSVQAGLTNVMTDAVKSASKGSGRSTHTNDSLTYTPDPEVSRSAESALIGLTQKSNPAAVGRLKKSLREHDIIAMFDRDMRPFDLSSDNLADVFTAFIVSNWMIANRADIPRKNAVAAVRNNIANGMGHAIGRLEERQRQMIAEILVYQTMFSIGARTAAVDDPDRMRALSDQAQIILGSMGVNARNYQLDENGLTPL